jgi:hypothetical protein
MSAGIYDLIFIRVPGLVLCIITYSVNAENIRAVRKTSMARVVGIEILGLLYKTLKPISGHLVCVQEGDYGFECRLHRQIETNDRHDAPDH